MPDARPPLSASLAGLDGDPGDSLRRIAAMGYRAVQLPITAAGLRPRDLDGAIRRALRGTLRRMELALSGLDLWIPPGHFIDPMHADRAATAVLAAIDLAADLSEGAASMGESATRGAGHGHAGRVAISLVLPQAPADRVGLKDLLEGVLAAADRQGIDLVDHALPVADAAMVASVACGGRWQVGVDVPAWIAAGTGDFAGPLIAMSPRLASVRLCDLSRSGMRVPIADRASGASVHDSRLDAAALAAALSVAAPALIPVADPRQWSDPWAGLAQTLSVWRRAIGAD